MAEQTVEKHDEVARREQEGTRAPEEYIRPPVDIYEQPDGLVVVADLPGVNKDNLSIEVKDSILTLTARPQHSAPGDSIHREFRLIPFHRQFELSDRVDVAKIKADFKNGVLTLKLPKAEEAKPRKIEVQVG